eukprot:6308802-Alexandrium_andersonii.AAC.1
MWGKGLGRGLAFFTDGICHALAMHAAAAAETVRRSGVPQPMTKLVETTAAFLCTTRAGPYA